MYGRLFVGVVCFALFATNNPLAGSLNEPISKAEWTALHEGGLKARSGSLANQRIPHVTPQAATGWGRTSRQRHPLMARDKIMHCGHRVNGKGGNNGHGIWIPVKEFASLADEFCASLKRQQQSKISLLTLILAKRQRLHRH